MVVSDRLEARTCIGSGEQISLKRKILSGNAKKLLRLPILRKTKVRS